MFTFVLGGDKGLWNNVLSFLKVQKDFAYLLPFLILIVSLYICSFSLVDKLLFKN